MKKENLLKIITLNERGEEEAASRPDILHFVGQGNFIFITEKSGNFERDVCGNHVMAPLFFSDYTITKTWTS